MASISSSFCVPESEEMLGDVRDFDGDSFTENRIYFKSLCSSRKVLDM